MSFVISDGAVRGLSRPDLPGMPRLQISDSLSMAHEEIWRKQPAVRTSVTFLARNIAQLGLHAFRRVGDTDRQRLIDHALPLLIGKPNPWTTRYRLMDSLVHDLGIYDRAHWQKVKTSSGLGLVRLPPSMVTPKGDDWLTPSVFEVKGSKGTREVLAESMVYFRGYAPANDFGTSPIESLRQILAEEWHSSRSREQTLRNGARMSGYLQRPKEAGKWEPEARDRFREHWRAQYTGDGPATGGTPILEDGMTFTGVSQTSEQLQYIEARKLTREEVAAAYFIPPPMVGLLDNATFSNITEQHKMLYQDTLGPWLTMIADELALQLIPDLPDSDRVYVEFNLAEKLTGSFETRSDSMQRAVGGPFLTVNEARAMDNRPPIERGDVLIRPLNVTQNGDDKPIPAAPGDDPASEEG
ncbi:HK97 family phage portal protein [Rhodococcus sp. OK611]|uniref:phage portal protein n=1 Tax=unclassified Rhodococcus (in: high G+C Gram-positive bacteria) TaxID=192944 RepID=UPI000BCA37AE|nr:MULTISPECIES: phage portal protein [unclassified Rhodococcus (in: high G+C Gram-positive bacteria)]PTR42038.1 HK97 family phage portal protein [Rhodococcus sp. OK611]SNX91515.1 phage portal protein, HK97 family [Rhodococcus sp. OK270]